MRTNICQDRLGTNVKTSPKKGRFTQDASEEIKDLIDPTWRLGENYADPETGEVLREDSSEYLDRYPPAHAVAAEAQAARL